MKPFLFFALLISFSLSTAAQKYREVDLRVNGVGSGTPYSTVVRRIGKPLRSKRERYEADVCSASAETHMTPFYPGLAVTLLGDGKGRGMEVYSIKITSKRWSASGVYLGASAKDVINRFGEPNSRDDESARLFLNMLRKAILEE